MSNFYLSIPEIKINYNDIQQEIEQSDGWQEITPEHENHGYTQFYKKYEPKWLTDQLLPIWSYMGILIACRAGEYLLPHVDTGRTTGILIPCTKSYEENTLDFWQIPEWQGTIGKQQKFHDHNSGKIIESVKYTTPILFKNVPHGVDNRTSTFDRINLSICFMEPYTFEVVSDLYQKDLLMA